MLRPYTRYTLPASDAPGLDELVRPSSARLTVISSPGAQMANVTRRSVLHTLTRPQLHELNVRHDRSPPKAKLVETRATLTLPALLAQPKFDELRTVCRTHALDAGGRQKAALVARLLAAQEPATIPILEPAKAPSPPLQKRGSVNVDQAGDAHIKAARDLIAGDHEQRHGGH